MTIADLYVYPLKSCRGVRVPSAALDGLGFEGDRRWMLIDARGGFLSQRRLPRMALIVAALRPEGGLHLEAPAMPPLLVDVPPLPARRVTTAIWSDTCELVLADDEASAWASAFLGQPVRLVHCPTPLARRVDPAYAQPEDRVGLADGFPLLAVGQGSLDDLNAHLADRGQAPVPMSRFRPNIVIGGLAPFEEDDIAALTTSAGVRIEIVKPCARCAIVRVDQETGVSGDEPFKTLATYRQRDGLVMFGQNLLHRTRGTIQVGDRLEIASRRR